MRESREASLFRPPDMAAIFSPRAHVRGMVAFEAALARAEARAGIMPAEAAEAIAAACRVELFDVEAIYREAQLAGTPAIPLVRMLTERVGGDAQQFVHWGTTSQDAIDTAMMLQMREGLGLLIDELLDLCDACAALAGRHRYTLMAGRTLLQQAVPITFGLKAARWLALAVRQVQSLQQHRDHTLAVQLGGAAGTLAALGNEGPEVTRLLAEELGLLAPDLPWHTERDRVAAIAASLGVVAGAMAKMAGDVVLLAQTEVAEVTEGAAPGKGGSSAMPQKRNPVDATFALASARVALGVVPVILSAMAQEHERAAGGWQTEWETIPDLFCYTASAVERVRSAVSGLQIDAARMDANLDAARGLIMSESLTMTLARHMGKPEAQRFVKALADQAAAQGSSLHQAARADERVLAVLSPEEINRAFDPGSYLGSTDTFIDRALKSYREVRLSRGGT